MGISQKIATFAINTKRTLTPKSARKIAELSLRDWITVVIVGRDEPVSRIVLQMLLDEGGSPQASIIGSRVTLSARAAALYNGAISHPFHYDDTHFLNFGHPSVAVIPAVMATAEKIGLNSIDNFIDAGLIDSEVACRILELSVEQTTHALGLCATRNPGIEAQFGTMGKPYPADMAASNGIEVAILTADGFFTNPDTINTLQGFSTTHASEAHKPAMWYEPSSDFFLNQYNINFTQAAMASTPCLKPSVKHKMVLAGYDTRREETFSDAACKNPCLLEICNRVTVSMTTHCLKLWRNCDYIDLVRLH